MPRPRKHRDEKPAAAKDPVPRIARLLALAHKWEGMVRRGEVKDYAEIARRMELNPIQAAMHMAMKWSGSGWVAHSFSKIRNSFVAGGRPFMEPDTIRCRSSSKDPFPTRALRDRRSRCC